MILKDGDSIEIEQYEDWSEGVGGGTFVYKENSGFVQLPTNGVVISPAITSAGEKIACVSQPKIRHSVCSSLSKAVIDLGGKLPKGTVKGYFVSGNCIMLKGQKCEAPSFVCSTDDFEGYVNKIKDTTFDMLTGLIC